MDTIVAIATPPGRSAIGVIRLSGPESLQILRALINDEQFSPKPNHVQLKELHVTGESSTIDQVLVTYFAAPRSFSGEEMVEISCHGSPLILRQVLDEALRLDARLAEPGEFTLRAMRSGKMNLSQAEAIRDLINARTQAAAQQANRQLKGELSAALQPAKEQLIAIIVRLESALEFVEDDLPQFEITQTMDHVVHIRELLEQLATTYDAGHLLRDGLKVALVGRPNVGKSSLFNQLLRFDRAIVTEIPGTTRDSLTEAISLHGVPVQLTDTAGVREATDMIEAIGVERTHRVAADADLLVVVIDGSTELVHEDEKVLALTKEIPHLVAINKTDLSINAKVLSQLNGQRRTVRVSALTGEGIDDLSTAILEPFGACNAEAQSLVITDSRHRDLLVRAQQELIDAEVALRQGASEEIVLVGLHNALKYLGQITGETTTEEILGEIFSTFCIGK